jgi:ABC-type Mn2+/Zn2+ transport system permease subunit
MNISGVILSFYADLPFAPIITLCGGGVFTITLICSSLKKMKQSRKLKETLRL